MESEPIAATLANASMNRRTLQSLLASQRVFGTEAASAILVPPHHIMGDPPRRQGCQTGPTRTRTHALTFRTRGVLEVGLDHGNVALDALAAVERDAVLATRLHAVQQPEHALG